MSSYLRRIGGKWRPANYPPATSEAPPPPPPPIPVVSTITGFNTALGSGLPQASMDTRILSFGGRVTMGRGYNGTGSLPADGRDWTGNGAALYLTGQHPTQVAKGIVSDQRLQWNMRLARGSKAAPGTNYADLVPTQARIEEVLAWVKGWPWGAPGSTRPWRKVILSDHEYNGFYWDTTTPDAIIVKYMAATMQIARRLYAWQVAQGYCAPGAEAPVTWSWNIAGSGLGASKLRTIMIPDAVPGATTNTTGGKNPYYGLYSWSDPNYADTLTYDPLPPGTVLAADDYDNPNGGGSLRGYATSYGSEKTPNQITGDIDTFYQVCSDHGFLRPEYGWGRFEVNSPQRIAPVVPTSLPLSVQQDVRTKIGWPLSTDTYRGPDLDGTRRAAALRTTWDYAQTKPVRPKYHLWWTQEDGVRWNQAIVSAGSAIWDARVDTAGNLLAAPLTTAQIAASNPHPTLFQGWPKPTSQASIDAVTAVFRDTVTASPNL